MHKIPKVVCIGGGTGTYTVLSGLKKYPVSLSAVITMMDSGGSSGRLRDQLGVLPPGDLRQALVALSECEKEWRDLFIYRFSEGDLAGHNFGNIFISTLEKTTGSLDKAITLATNLLHSKGNVIPVTFDNVQLCVSLVDGTHIIGETHIDETSERILRSPIKTAYLRPVPKANFKAVDAILHADTIILGPGDLYTSIIPNLLVPEIKNAFKKSSSTIISVVNLMTKLGQTDNYGAWRHVQILEGYLEKKIDCVMVNTKKPDAYALSWYKQHKEYPVLFDFTKKDTSNYKIITGNYLSEMAYHTQSSDDLRRSLVRHNSEKLAKALISLL